MIKTLKLIRCACLLITFHVSTLPAQDLTVPPAGDATAEAPTIFRVYSLTNLLAAEFLAGFSETRSNFLAAVQDTFQQATLDEKSLASPDFGYLVTAFNIKNKKFPVTEKLATDWARGGSGQAMQTKLLDSLLKIERRYIRPDELPENFVIGKTARLVPADRPNEKQRTLPAAGQDEQIAASNISALSNTRAGFCREFSADEQPLAHAVSEWLQPNCIPDVELTRLARDRVPRQPKAIEPFAASRASPPAAPELSTVLPASNPAQSLTPAPTAPAVAPEKKPAKIPGPAAWLLAAISVVSATASILLARKRKTGPAPVRAIKFSPQTPVLLQPELAPIVQAVKETFVQELALQRRELILAQQQAAAEIVELIRRLDKLQVPMQERLKAYELEIQRLEKTLAERTAENRELIKYRIELTRQQLEAERLGTAHTN